MRHEESGIQIAFMFWVQKQYPKFYPFLFHIPNGGKMPIQRAIYLKKMGVKAGVADVLFMFRTTNFGGLWLEFKSSKGKQSIEQQEFEKLAHIALYDYQVVKSFEEAKEAFERYLEDIKVICSKKCRYCSSEFLEEKKVKECEKYCKFMIQCYMNQNNCSFEEAKKTFLMERI